MTAENAQIELRASRECRAHGPRSDLALHTVGWRAFSGSLFLGMRGRPTLQTEIGTKRTLTVGSWVDGSGQYFAPWNARSYPSKASSLRLYLVMDGSFTSTPHQQSKVV